MDRHQGRHARLLLAMDKLQLASKKDSPEYESLQAEAILRMALIRVKGGQI